MVGGMVRCGYLTAGVKRAGCGTIGARGVAIFFKTGRTGRRLTDTNLFRTVANYTDPGVNLGKGPVRAINTNGRLSPIAVNLQIGNGTGGSV